MIANSHSEEENAEKDNELYQHLKNIGFAFPDNEEELEHLIELMEDHKIDAPSNITASAILKNGILKLQEDLNSSTDQEVEENLARAAREGGQISEDVIKKMKEDRENSEKESSNDEPK